MLILAETADSPTATDRSIAAELAQIMGLLVYPVPPASPQSSLEQALQQVPDQPEKTPAIWLAERPTIEQYRSFYQTALQKGIALLNSPEQHEAVQCFDRLVDDLRGLLPDDQMLTAPGQSQSDLGRVFRVFFYRQLLTYAYLWDVDDPLKWLSVEEEEELLTVATDATQRLPDAFVAIDLGQQTSGQWRVLNVSDAQFAITRQVPLPHLWHELREGIDRFGFAG